MKPGLVVLPMDVWADILDFPWITRKKLAHIVDQFKERAFAEKCKSSCMILSVGSINCAFFAS